jgi:hypothetical protein
MIALLTSLFTVSLAAKIEIAEVPLLYANVCKNDPDSCSYLPDESKDLYSRFPSDFIVNHELFENIGKPKEYN